MNDKWRYKDIIFYGFIIIWILILVTTKKQFQGSPYWFLCSAGLLLILRYTLFRKWWNKPLKKDENE